MAYEPPIVDTGLPSYLLPADTKLQSTNDQLTNYSWEKTILQCLGMGQTMMSIVKEQLLKPEQVKNPREVNRYYSRLMTWVHKDPTRKQQYYDAQEQGTEALVDKMMEIAQGDDSLEDIARSTLRVNTIKWVVSARNRKRYGDTKQLDANFTIDLGKAMIEASQRQSELVKTITISPTDAD